MTIVVGNRIFDYQKLRVHKSKAKSTAESSSFFIYVNEDVIERLNVLDKQFQNILNLGYFPNYLTNLLNNNYKDSIIHELVFDEELLLKTKCHFDLIIFCLGLHWVNDIPNFLSYVYNALTPNGILIGNFIGANSLKNLRLKFIELESQLNQPHYPHISPFIKFNHITPLLAQAGFTEIIADFELIDLEYKNPLHLMKAIKSIGESNKLQGISGYTISKDMLQLLTYDSPFLDQVNLISFIAAKNKGDIRTGQNHRFLGASRL